MVKLNAVPVVNYQDEGEEFLLFLSSKPDFLSEKRKQKKRRKEWKLIPEARNMKEKRMLIREEAINENPRKGND